MIDNICPRCHGGIPNDSEPGGFRGAMSRATSYRDIEVCSPCGTDEVYNLVPVAQWPVAAWAPQTIEMLEFVANARREHGGFGPAGQ